MEQQILEGIWEEIVSHNAAQLTGRRVKVYIEPEANGNSFFREHLPPTSTIDEEALDAKLRRWQEQYGTVLMPDVSTQTLFAEWADEDADMTEQEREAEDRLWEDIEQGLTENSGTLRLRRLSE